MIDSIVQEIRVLPRFLFIAVWFVVLANPARAAPSIPVISAPEAIVIDGWTGHVLYARSPNVERDPASTVKIMTALVVLEHRIPLKQVETVSPFAATFGGSTAGLYAGEQLTVRNLLYGMLLPSGNDAAIALSETVSPEEDRFVALMNAEARRLHLWHTRFVNPNGFDTWGQLTTARDLAFLARAAMQWRIFARVVRTRSWVAWSADGRIMHQWSSLNQLLGAYPAVDGIKTGTTPGAGACLVSSALKNGKWVIAVNLGSSVADRFSDGIRLLNYGFLLEEEPPSTG